jgi:hypothetical protein
LERGRSLGCRKTGGVSGIGGGAQRMRGRMGNSGGLAGRSGGRNRRESLHVTRGATSDKPVADLFGNAKLAASKGPRPGDRVAGAAISWSFCLEQLQDPFCAVRRPRCDDAPVSFA